MQAATAHDHGVLPLPKCLLVLSKARGGHQEGKSYGQSGGEDVMLLAARSNVGMRPKDLQAAMRGDHVDMHEEACLNPRRVAPTIKQVCGCPNPIR